MLNILKYRSAERSAQFASDPGSPEKITYHGRVETDGIITLVEDGIINIQEQIDSYEPSTDIYNIINNLGMDALRADTGNYFDATEVPKSYAEMLQLFIDGEKAFERLPVEVKQKFDNDFNKWFATAGSEEWLKKCGYGATIEDVVKEEVKEEVSE